MKLLVDMFFDPTFIRCFKPQPKLPLFFATFVAAGFGNTLDHFLFHTSTASRFGLLSYISRFPFSLTGLGASPSTHAQ